MRPARPGWILAALLATAAALAGCGPTPSQPISASNPLYVLAVDKGELQVDVISRPSYALSGTIPIQSVGSTPPVGAVRVNGTDSVVVTQTGSSLGAQAAVSPSTLSCAVSKASCTTLIGGWGSATVLKAAGKIAVPIWNSSDVTRGELAWLAGSPLRVDRRIALAPTVPGPLEIAPDGAFLYWLTSSTENGGSTAQPRLIRYDLANKRIAGEVRFGQRVPNGLAVGRDGSVYLSMLYDTPPIRGGSPQGTPGNLVATYNPDLSPIGSLKVANFPSLIAVSAAGDGALAVAYTAPGPRRIDVFNPRSGALLQQISPPGNAPIGQLSTLANGDFAVTVGAPSTFQMGIFDASGLKGSWHTYQGAVASAADG